MSEIKEERVTDLSIIMEMIDSKPYYSVQYRNVGEDGYNIGYSSYNLKTVLEFIGEYFEIVESDRQTNADRIRNMSDEELAEFMQKMECSCFVDFIGYADKGCGRNEIPCKDCRAKAPTIFEWLQSKTE